MAGQNTNPEGFILANEFFVFDASGNTSTPFAYSTECTLSLSSDTIETSNKMSGVWAAALPGQISWEVSTSALYSTTAANSYNSLYDSVAHRTPYLLRIGRVQNYNNISDYTNASNYVLDASAGFYEGYAYITSLELNASNNEVASYSATFTGNGQLVYKTSTSA